MALFNAYKYDVKAFGQQVTIPNADIARIMYYIDCVCTVIDYNEANIQRYRNYSNWANMSDEEDRLIFLLALTLSPDEFEDKVFFENAQLAGDHNNQFYEIGQLRNQILVVPSLIIGGQSRQVKKIMAYKSQWMRQFYYIPMANLLERFNPKARPAPVRRQVTSTCTVSWT